MSKQYEHINFVPPKQVAAEAERGLEYRKKAGGKGGLAVSEAKTEGVGSGVQRAVNLKNRDKMSPETVKRMKAFFDRHQKNKSVDPRYKKEPWKDRGYVAWLLWGGDPGYLWAKKIVHQMEKADKSIRKGHKMISIMEPLREIARIAAEKTVGINKFVMRQTKPDFAGTKVSAAKLEQLRKEAERAINSGRDKKGYADFVRVVTIKDPSVSCNIAKITPQNRKFLKTEKTRRTDESREEEYEHRFFDAKDVKGMPSHHVDLILYTRDQLEREKSDPTGADFDLISVNAEATATGAPLSPTTMRRNIKGPESGGSGHQHTEEEIARSEKFWENHALIK